jgi:hypothetical protein
MVWLRGTGTVKYLIFKKKSIKSLLNNHFNCLALSLSYAKSSPLNAMIKGFK